jgi:hypothetical protein
LQAAKEVHDYSRALKTRFELVVKSGPFTTGHILTIQKVDWEPWILSMLTALERTAKFTLQQVEGFRLDTGLLTTILCLGCLWPKKWVRKLLRSKMEN